MGVAKDGDILYIKDEGTLLLVESVKILDHFKSVDIVEGNEAALRSIDSSPYDLIINDMSVDAKGGIELLKHLKQMNPKTRTVALMSAKDEPLIGHLIQHGINAFVLEAEQLKEALDAISEMDTATL